MSKETKGRQVILTRITDIRIIADNLRRIRHKCGLKILMVVKANAYGHGLYAASRLESETDYFGVARASEGKTLRELGVKCPILVMSYNREECALMGEYSLIGGVDSPENLVGLESVHIAVDTGMNRFGVKNISELDKMLSMAKDTRILGVFSHIYHNAATLINSQYERLTPFVERVRAYNPEALVHIGSSGSYDYPYAYSDMVRIGRAAYDGACTVISNILCVKKLDKGESVGYGGEFVADKRMRIAVVEGGYADGIDKRNSGGYVAISGRRCRIIGAVSMDSFMIDLSETEAKTGDEVIICDRDTVSVEEIASRIGCSTYEVMTGLKGRYRYVYCE